MKRFVKCLLALLLVLPLIYFTKPNQLVTTVNAACSSYEVVNIRSDGSQESIACTDSFGQAKEIMWGYSNGAIKHPSSLSPMKFVAMTRGVVQSYPFRLSNGSGSHAVTMNIYQNASDHSIYWKYTYVSQHYEMAYFDTTEYSGPGGTVEVGLAGFRGYADLRQVDLIPMIYIENKISMTLGGNTYYTYGEAPYRINQMKHSYFKVETNNGVRELRFVSYSYYCSADAPTTCTPTTKANVVIGPAADWMVDNATYYSWDFIHYYHDMGYTQSAGTYYNYFTFLSYRTTSTITADQLNQYMAAKRPSSVMAGKGAAFISGQETYGVNALLVYAMAIHESGYGTSTIAVNKNNLFGWAAVDSNPGDATYFSSVEQCVKEQMGVNLRGYMDVVTDGRFFGTHTGTKANGFNVKYASDPYWGLKISAYAYDIDKTFGFQDLNAYTIAVINQFDAAVYASPGSNQLYGTRYGVNYQDQFLITINLEKDGYYQFPSPVGVRANKTMIVHKTDGTTNPIEAYSFINSAVYVAKSQVSVVSSSKYQSTYGLASAPAQIEGSKLAQAPVVSISLSTSQDKFNISGYSFQPGIRSEQGSLVSHTLIFTLNSNTSVKKTINLGDAAVPSNIASSYNTSLISVAQAGFSQSGIDLSDLAPGTYTVTLLTRYPDFNFQYESQIPIGSLDNRFSLSSGKLQFVVAESLPDTGNYQVVTQKLYYDLAPMSWTSDNKLKIIGAGAFLGIDASDPRNVTQTLRLIKKDNGAITEIQLSVKKAEDVGMDYFFLDGETDYTYVWFTTDLDFSTIDVGLYNLELTTTIADHQNKILYTGTKALTATAFSALPAVRKTTTKTVVTDKIARFSYQYELSVYPVGYYDTISVRKKPTPYQGYFSVERFAIKSGKLTVEGFLALHSLNHSSSSLPSYQLLLLDSSFKVVKTFDLTTTTGQYDITQYISYTTYNYDHAWFYGENLDLTTLANGNYYLFFKVKNGSYQDVVAYISDPDVYTISGTSTKTFSFTKSSVYDNVVILTVK
ncbi:MAG: glucosaminidase domain-containing protein [Erysipelotrichaceae bacterium]|nr:glucosaminidase domain-containing protein [Erysipelotrichaceae bacterium]